MPVPEATTAASRKQQQNSKRRHAVRGLRSCSTHLAVLLIADDAGNLRVNLVQRTVILEQLGGCTGVSTHTCTSRRRCAGQALHSSGGGGCAGMHLVRMRGGLQSTPAGGLARVAWQWKAGCWRTRCCLAASRRRWPVKLEAVSCVHTLAIVKESLSAARLGG